MSSELGDRRFVKSGCISGGGNGIQAEPENVQCPRCESTNTKFCYYNNYNLSQPRYFCKACRRYWTRGGSLRNIPVGGGSRKNSKRSRPSHSSSSTSTATSSHPPPPPPPPPSVLDSAPDVPAAKSFSSLMVSAHQENPFLGLGGYGLGLGFDGLGFGPTDGSSNHQEPLPSSGCNTWQVVEGEGAGMLTDTGDCFGWPELAISTPGTARLERSFWPTN